MFKRLGKSPINYFSDLFIAAMVVAWIVVTTIMVGVGIYSTVVLEDSSMWSDVSSLVAVPLTGGGAIWMVKNSVQHAIANKNGRECPVDFPAVNDDISAGEMEKPMFETEDSEENEETEDEESESDV